MFITQTYKSVNWLKNQTKEGGAMEEVLKTKKEDDIAFNIISKKFGRMWGSCDNTTALKLIEKNSGLNEILHKFPMKVYFYIDKTENLKADDITTYKNIILKYIPDAKMAISGSETNEKHSYHITLTNYVFNDMIERDDFKIFVKEYLFEEDNGFDTKVYTKNRNMKCIKQSKPGCSRVQMILEDDKMENHFITAFINMNAKSVTLPKKVVEKTVEKNKQQRKLNILSLPESEVMNASHLLEVMNNMKYTDLFEARNLLNLLPISKEFDHTYTWMVARFCYSNDLEFTDFWNWYVKKNNSQTHLDKWTHHWSVLDDHPPVSRSQIMLVLEKYYPGIRNDKEVKDFVRLCDISEFPFIEIEKLSQKEFYNDKKAVVINIGIGGEKNTQTVAFFRRNDANRRRF